MLASWSAHLRGLTRNPVTAVLGYVTAQNSLWRSGGAEIVTTDASGTTAAKTVVQVDADVYTSVSPTHIHDTAALEQHVQDFAAWCRRSTDDLEAALAWVRTTGFVLSIIAMCWYVARNVVDDPLGLLLVPAIAFAVPPVLGWITKSIIRLRLGLR